MSGSYNVMFKSGPETSSAVFDMFPNPEPASRTTSPLFTLPLIPLILCCLSFPNEMYEFTLSYTGIISCRTSKTSFQ